MSGPVNEWVIHDADSLRAAIRGMKAKRKLSLEDIFHKMGSRVLNKIIRGEQDNLRSDSIIRAVNELGFELVIREPQRTKTQQRLAALRAERDKVPPESAVADPDRDGQGKLTRPLTDEERSQVEDLLERYSDL